MNILFILHSSPTASIRGGVEEHINDLISSDQFTRNFGKIYFLYPSNQFTQIHQQYSLTCVKPSLVHTIETLRLSTPVTNLSYKNLEFSDHIKKIILAKLIDIVHIHHLLNYPLNLPLVAKQAGAKVILSIHDYFLICPQFNLIDYKDQFCGYPNVSRIRCDICLKHTHKLQSNSQLQRQILVSELFCSPDLIHSVSHDVQKRLKSAYPHIEEKIQLVMGVGIDSVAFPKSKPIKVVSKTVNIGFIGNFTSNKGAKDILDVLEYFIENRDKFSFKFHIIGDIRQDYKENIYFLSKQFPMLVKIFGSYDKSSLSKILDTLDIHAAVFASIWPETFLITLSEVFSANIIPIVPNIGAPKDRVKNNQTGLLYQYDDIGSLISKIQACADVNVIELISKNISNQSEYPTLEENITNYIAHYRLVMKQDDPLIQLSGLKYKDIVGRVLETNRSTDWGSIKIPGHEVSQKEYQNQRLSFSKFSYVLKQSIYLYGFKSTIKRSAFFLFRKLFRSSSI